MDEVRLWELEDFKDIEVGRWYLFKNKLHEYSSYLLRFKNKPPEDFENLHEFFITYDSYSMFNFDGDLWDEKIRATGEMYKEKVLLPSIMIKNFDVFILSENEKEQMLLAAAL